MVVLSASVMSKQSLLVARQFVEITKIRIEGLLSAFLKLVETGGKDHTYIETDSVRYVYQPIESLYLLLITNKASNILEDLETLRILQQCVQNACVLTPILAEHVQEKAFDIVFAFDEVISFGYREAVTLGQIKTYTAMESHEEKLQNLLREQKEQDENARRKQIASKLDKEFSVKRREDRERQRSKVNADFDALTTPPASRSSGPGTIASTSTAGGGALSGGALSGRAFERANVTAAWTGAGGGAMPSKGMQLGKKSAAVVLQQQQTAAANWAADGDLLMTGGGADGGGSGGASTPTMGDGGDMLSTSMVGGGVVSNPLAEPVGLSIDEKISASMLSEGEVLEVDLQGQLKMTVLDVSRAQMAAVTFAKGLSTSYKFSAHPNLNKQSYSTGVLEVADPSKAFKQNVSVQLLKWRPVSKTTLVSCDGGSFIFPLSAVCWPSATGDGKTAFVVEIGIITSTVMTSSGPAALQNVTDVKMRFTLPTPSGVVDVSQVSKGRAEREGDQLVWYVGELGAGEGEDAALEFVAVGEAAGFFPLTVEGASTAVSVCGLTVNEVYQQGKQDAKLLHTLKRCCTFKGTIAA